MKFLGIWRKNKMETILNMLLEISEDSLTPKSIKEKLNVVSSILKQETDCSVKVNKALHELDDVVNDNNMDQFTRTQIWNVVSLLEKVDKN